MLNVCGKWYSVRFKKLIILQTSKFLSLSKLGTRKGNGRNSITFLSSKDLKCIHCNSFCFSFTSFGMNLGTSKSAVNWKGGKYSRGVIAHFGMCHVSSCCTVRHANFDCFAILFLLHDSSQAVWETGAD